MNYNPCIEINYWKEFLSGLIWKIKYMCPDVGFPSVYISWARILGFGISCGMIIFILLEIFNRRLKKKRTAQEMKEIEDKLKE